MTDRDTLRAVLTNASRDLLSGRVRDAGCDFLNSHRDGPCAKCLARDAHDAEIAAAARLAA